MKISIVTISFNQVDFLCQAMRSVIDQGYPDLEYIVVDPGSTDGSRELIEQHRARIHRVVFEPDRGPADGLNKGFRHATGEILGFLNSDDLLLDGALASVSEYFSNHPEIDIVSGHCAILDRHGRTLRYSYSDRFSLLRHAYGAANLMQPSTFFRSSTFARTTGFNPENRSNWDGELFVDMALAGARFSRLDRVLSGYRLHPSSITQTRKLDDQIGEYRRRMFLKIVNRNPRWYDVMIALSFRAQKYFREPRNLYERLTKGKIYGRDDA